MASHQVAISVKSRNRPPPSSSIDDKVILKDLGYTLIKKIGSGSFAKVWRTKSPKFKKEIAVKIITKQTASKEYVEKFLPREIMIIQKLKHPNIIKFYEITQTRHSVYIVMQLAENGTIAELIDAKKFLAEDEARVFFRQIIDVIDYCHRNGIVHRDIKCENLLLDRHNKLLLTDFGFSKEDVFPQSDGRVRRSRTYCGSYAYASPEVLSNVPYDPQLSDVWCMGMVLYAMLLGFLPYKQTDVKVMIGAKKKPPNFPESSQISTSSKKIIKRMLALESERARIKDLRKDPWVLSTVEKEKSHKPVEKAGPSSSTTTRPIEAEESKLSLAFSFNSDEKHDKAVSTRVKKKAKRSHSAASDSSWEGTILRSKLD